MPKDYKIEITLNSQFDNFTKEEIENKVRELIENTHPLLRDEFKVKKINALNLQKMDDLRKEYFKETGNFYLTMNNTPRIHYMEWLENKLINKL